MRSAADALLLNKTTADREGKFHLKSKFLVKQKREMIIHLVKIAQASLGEQHFPIQNFILFM